MGAACSVEITMEITNVLWIDPEIDNEEFRQYEQELETNKTLKVKLFSNVDEAIEFMKEIKFQETKVIVNGGLYADFVSSFKANAHRMYFAPKIIVFTSNKENFIENNKEYQNNEDMFYKFGKVANTFKKIKKFLKSERDNLMEFENKPKKEEEEEEDFETNDLIVEYIDTKEKVMLTLFFKAIIDPPDGENNKKFYNFLFKTYSNENDELKSLLYTIAPMTDIPNEILSKYYIRIFNVSNNFYKDVLKNLSLNKSKGLMPFIKTLYDGIKLSGVPLVTEKALYKGVNLSDELIKKIKINFKKKVKHLPSSIMFTKSFMTFNKDRISAENNLAKLKREKNFTKVMLTIDKRDDAGYQFSTYSDIESLSYYPNQKEALLFPFSVWEVCSIKEVAFNREVGYEIKLQFLKRFKKFIETDKTIIETEIALPESEFKNQICEFGLINKETADKITTKELYEQYKKYDEVIKNKEEEII